MKIIEINQEEWEKWVSTRPKVIQDMCKKLPPGRLYKMKGTGQKVTIVSYSEDRTVTVSVDGRYNLVTFDRNVFGVDPDSLEECHLPSSDEPIGTICVDVGMGQLNKEASKPGSNEAL